MEHLGNESRLVDTLATNGQQRSSASAAGHPPVEGLADSREFYRQIIPRRWQHETRVIGYHEVKHE